MGMIIKTETLALHNFMQFRKQLASAATMQERLKIVRKAH
jgi:hypothetical protein